MAPVIALRCPAAFRRFESSHAPLREPARCADGDCITLLRTPWRRALSGFFHNLHDCRWMQRAHGLEQESTDRTSTAP